MSFEARGSRQQFARLAFLALLIGISILLLYNWTSQPIRLQPYNFADHADNYDLPRSTITEKPKPSRIPRPEELYPEANVRVNVTGVITQRKSCATIPLPRSVACDASAPQIGRNFFNRCSSYKGRYSQYMPMLEMDDWQELTAACPRGKTMLAVMLYDSLEITPDLVLNIAALYIEMAGTYDLKLLYQVPNDVSIFSSERAKSEYYAKLPKALHHSVEFWSELQLQMVYPGIEAPVDPPQPVAGQHRGCYMLYQILATKYGDDYNFFAKWEADMRWTGDYYDFFMQAERYGVEQPEDDQRDAIYHTRQYQRKTYIQDIVPADFITFNPIFQVDGSQWYHRWDVNWVMDRDGKELVPPPRKCSVIAGAILSTRLLRVMHALNSGDLGTFKKHIFCEAWAPSVARYAMLYAESDGDSPLIPAEGFKSVYFPHEILLKAQWPPSTLHDAINAKDFHAHEDWLWYSSWAWNSKWARTLYVDWRSNADYMTHDESGNALMQHVLLHPVKEV